MKPRVKQKTLSEEKIVFVAMGNFARPLNVKAGHPRDMCASCHWWTWMSVTPTDIHDITNGGSLRM